MSRLPKNHNRFWMRSIFLLLLLPIIASGCLSRRVDPERPMSRDLPLSYVDIAEIKKGSEDHREVMKAQPLYHNPELEMYVAGIGYKIAAVSERPQLPYRFFIIDDERVDMFSVGGGYIYITKGLLQFVQSEAELAAALSHEISHVASGAHTPDVDRKMTKKQMFFQAVKLGAGAAAGAAAGGLGGPAERIAENALDGIKNSMPNIRKQFQKSEELLADRNAILYLVKANYDPRELEKFLDKISRIRIADVDRYIYFLNSHPPYEERRAAVKELLREINFGGRNFELRTERFASIRMMTMQFDNVNTKPVSNQMVVTASVDTKPVT